MDSRFLAVLSETDVIKEAYEAGIAAGHGDRKSPRDAIPANAALDELLALIRAYPGHEDFQWAAARSLGEDRRQATALWQGMVARFPHSHDAFCALLAATVLHSGAEAARALIDHRYACLPCAAEHLARLEQTDEGMLRLFPEQDRAWRATAARIPAPPSSRVGVTLLDRAVAIGRVPIRKLLRIGTGRRAAELARERDVKAARAIGALGVLFDGIIARRNAHPPTSTSTRSVTMLTGSLGAGGGERQFVQTAIGLHALAEPSLGVRVIVRSLASRVDGGFFVGELQRAGIRTHNFQEFPDFGGDVATSAVRPAMDALKLVPARMARNVIKLSDELRKNRPDVVHIWQDGMIYHGGLAALLAGVPRIVLNARSVPPIDRPDRYRPEYDVIYRSLLSAENVVLSVNSRHAAMRFADWLRLDPAKIAVIPNGVAALPSAGGDDAVERYRRFDAATGPSPLTLGTVMRMDRNKRPFLWVDAAASILQVQPKARFILVGGGELREQTMRRVARQGIADRFLFVGLSSCVGYWLSKMDAFLLTSTYEGLPNSLIEAQLACVPAITTPAGGALEAVIPGVSALVTSADPAPEEIAARILVLMENPDLRRRMGEIGAGWAAEAFSVSRMLDRTVDFLGVARARTDGSHTATLAEFGHDLPRESAQRFDRRARIDQQDERHAAGL